MPRLKPALAAFAAVLAASGLIAVSPPAAAVAGVTPLLDVRFTGSFDGTAYRPAAAETVAGTLGRTGSTAQDGQAVTVNGGQDGLLFTPSTPLAGPGQGRSLILEAVVRRNGQATGAGTDTLFSIGGAALYRAAGGAWRYDMNGPASTGFRTVKAPAPAPSADADQHVALVYTAVDQDRSELALYVDGCAAGSALVNTTLAAVASGSIGLGRDSHPGAGDRGFHGRLSGVAVTEFTGAPSGRPAFRLPGGERCPLLLSAGFAGTLAQDGTYQPTPDETVEGSLTGAGTVTSGVLGLSGGNQGLRYTPSSSADGQNLVVEALVKRGAGNGNKDAVLSVGGSAAIRFHGDGKHLQTVTGEQEQPYPMVAEGYFDHTALVYQHLAAGGVRMTSYFNGCPTSSAVLPGAASTPQIGFGTGLSGALDAVAVSTFNGDPSAKLLRLRGYAGDVQGEGGGGKVEPANMIAIGGCDTEDVLVEKAANVVPTELQHSWQSMETISFVHFNMPTFINQEGGTGYEQPAQFNPTELDARQWARTLKAGGSKLAILTVKHADGFFAYPSKYTEHSVKNSPWKNGQGDLVKEFADAMRAEGIKVGLYFSPLSRQEMRVQPSQWLPGTFRFGNSDKKGTRPCAIPEEQPRFTFEVDEYNCVYMREMHELLTGYGDIDEVWLDGNGDGFQVGAGNYQVYEGAKWYQMARALQPGVRFYGGWDIRWIGNESGLARTTEWSALPIRNGAGDKFPRFMASVEGGDLGSRGLWNGAKNFVWSPGEVDVSIRPGWFYHPNEQPKSLASLWNIYGSSVGRNAVLLLNVAPDKRGLIPDADVARMAEFGQKVERVFGSDLALGADAANPGSPPSRQPGATVDGDPATAWHADGDRTLELDLGGRKTFDWIGVQELTTKSGQRVESFVVEAFDGTEWKQIAAGTTVGYKRLLKLAQPATAQQVRLRITGSRLDPDIAAFTLHRE